MAMPARQRVARPTREQTRRDILDAAGRAFARHGFHGASVEAVAGEAGLSTGAIYSNFESKADLFLTLYEERLATRTHEIRAVVGGTAGGDDALAAAAANVTEMFRASPEWLLLYFEFALLAARDPEFGRRFRELRRRGLEQLTLGIEDGLRRAGADASGADRMARVVRAVGYGLALEHVLGETEHADRALEDALRMILRGAL